MFKQLKPGSLQVHSNRRCAIAIALAMFSLSLSGCGGGGGGGGGGDDDNTNDTTATTFAGGSLDDLKALNPALTFDNLVITGDLVLPAQSSTTLQARNLTIAPTGGIRSTYSTCEWLPAPDITIDATGTVTIEGDILLRGRSGTRVTPGASCNSCYGENGGDVSISASEIAISAKVENYGGQGQSSTSTFGSSGCSGGDSGHLTLSAESMNLQSAILNSYGGPGGFGSLGDGSRGAESEVSLTTTGMFRMNPGSIHSDGLFTFRAGQTDIIGPITYGAGMLDALIGGEADNSPPTVEVLLPVTGETLDLGQPLDVHVQVSDIGLGAREVEISGFGYDAVYSLSKSVDGIFMVSNPSPQPDSDLQVTVRDNVMLEVVTYVTGLSGNYVSEEEPNNSYEGAQVLTLPVALTGDISTTDTGTCYPNIATEEPNPDCMFHTAQDFYSITVAEAGDYEIELFFENNGSATDLDLYASTFGDRLWCCSSVVDNAVTGIYAESIELTMRATDTVTIAVQAWPSWSGRADYTLFVRRAP